MECETKTASRHNRSLDTGLPLSSRRVLVGSARGYGLQYERAQGPSRPHGRLTAHKGRLRRVHRQEASTPTSSTERASNAQRRHPTGDRRQDNLRRHYSEKAQGSATERTLRNERTSSAVDIPPRDFAAPTAIRAAGVSNRPTIRRNSRSNLGARSIRDQSNRFQSPRGASDNQAPWHLSDEFYHEESVTYGLRRQDVQACDSVSWEENSLDQEIVCSPERESESPKLVHASRLAPLGRQLASNGPANVRPDSGHYGLRSRHGEARLSEIQPRLLARRNGDFRVWFRLVSACFVQLNKSPKPAKNITYCFYSVKWSERQDLNLRPLHPQFNRLAEKSHKLMKVNETFKSSCRLKQQLGLKIKDSMLFFVQLNKTGKLATWRIVPTGLPIPHQINHLTPNQGDSHAVSQCNSPPDRPQPYYRSPARQKPSPTIRQFKALGKERPTQIQETEASLAGA